MAATGNLFKMGLFLFAMAALLGCGRTADTGEGSVAPAKQDGIAAGIQEMSRPKISASPNPVPAGSGPGSTTITWDTADKSWSQIYITVDGIETKMLAQGARGSKDIDWIKMGATYEFRLYAGKEHQVLLGKVLVTRAKK